MAPTFGENPFQASPRGAYFWCAQVITMDGMYAGFAGAKTGHRGVTFCGYVVICCTNFLALVALATFNRAQGRTMGQAGAIVTTAGESAEEKVEIRREAGVGIIMQPSYFGNAVEEAMARL